MKIVYLAIASAVGLAAGYVMIILERMVIGIFGLEYFGWNCMKLKTEFTTTCEIPSIYATAGLFVLPCLVAIAAGITLYSVLTQLKSE